MAYKLVTKSGLNMFDMLSMMQKGIRRGLYSYAGFAANELEMSYRKAMWNRLLVISAEDCFGIITKEIVNLYKGNSNEDVSRAVALLCSAKKNRDACYFACNFVLASRKTRDIEIKSMHTAKAAWRNSKNKLGYNQFGFEQCSLFGDEGEDNASDEDTKVIEAGARLESALLHDDADMAGYEMDYLRKEHRSYLWQIFKEIVQRCDDKMIVDEIKALEDADEIVNGKKKAKDEIFISKAATIFLQGRSMYEKLLNANQIIGDYLIDWNKYKVMPMNECNLPGNGDIPEWVYDCHTLKGKREGKTDWDMTRTEELALNPKQDALFDEGSWLYTYEQDLQNKDITEEDMKPIREYAKTHAANPLPVVPYLESCSI